MILDPNITKKNESNYIKAGGDTGDSTTFSESEKYYEEQTRTPQEHNEETGTIGARCSKGGFVIKAGLSVRVL